MEINAKTISETHIDKIIDFCMELFFSYEFEEVDVDYNKIEESVRDNIELLLNNRIIDFSNQIYLSTGFSISEFALEKLESFASQFNELITRAEKPKAVIPEDRLEVNGYEFYFIKTDKEYEDFKRIGLKEENIVELVKTVINFLITYDIDLFGNESVAISQVEVGRMLSISPTIMSRLSNVVMISDKNAENKDKLKELFLSVRQLLLKKIELIWREDKDVTPGKVKLKLDETEPILKLARGELVEVEVPSTQYIKNLLKEIRQR